MSTASVRGDERRFRRACYAAEGILRGLEGDPEAAYAALEKLRWAINGQPDPDLDDEVIAAARVVSHGFDTGIFVRDTSRDGESDWARRAAPYLAALGRLVFLVDRRRSRHPSLMLKDMKRLKVTERRKT